MAAESSPQKGRPTRITPNPIIDSVIEFRFETSLPADAIFGVYYSQVRDQFPEFKKLQAADIPEEIRKIDTNLKHAPHYQAENGPFRLNLGPNVISISVVNEYVGWEENFKPFIASIVERLKKADIVTKFTRIGLRYIDFFKEDIFSKITISINYQNEKLKTFQDLPLEPKQTHISLIVESGQFTTRLNIQNNTYININNKSGIGSIIDTDTFYEKNEGFNFDHLEKLIPDIHECSVNIFFGILKQDFIESLNPVY